MAAGDTAGYLVARCGQDATRGGVAGRDGSVEVLLMRGRRRPLAGEGDFQVVYDPLDSSVVRDEGRHLRLGTKGGAGEGIDLGLAPQAKV